jgi:antitoxin Phd
MVHWPITLDDAIRIVLHECTNNTASTAFVADEINRRRLYIQKDGGPVFPEQMFLRARRYRELFEVIDKNTIRGLPAPRRKRVKR